MSSTATGLNKVQASAPGRLTLELKGLMFGALFSLVLFSVLARFQGKAEDNGDGDLVELHSLSLPVPPPPPPPPSSNTQELQKLPQDTMPLSGIDIEASNSPVKIAVAPPEVAFAMPPARPVPPAAISMGNLATVIKPDMEPSFGAEHVFQQNEVDQVPVAINRESPNVPYIIRRDAEQLRTQLLIVLEADGTVSSTRVVESSGVPEFDSLIAEAVLRRWTFNPAVRRGKKVRCMLMQAFTIRWSSRSPFQL